MYAIAIRTWRKCQSRRLPLSLPLDESVEEPTIADGVAARLSRMSLEAALLALPDFLRESFNLVKAEGLTHKEPRIY